jgi:hypothetical protein
MSFCASRKQFAAAVNLRVMRILDLQPRRSAAANLINPVFPLGRDAFEIHRARCAEEFDAAVLNMLDVSDAIIVRNDALKDGLPFEQRYTSEITPIKPEQIKRHVVRPVATKQQMVESTAAVGAKAHDLAVEHGIHAVDRMCKLGTEIRPRFEDVAAARHQPAMMTVDVRQRPEIRRTSLLHEIRMIERPLNPQQCRGCDDGEHGSIVPDG